MTAIGLFLMYVGYAILYWAWNGLQGNSQDPFLSYFIPGSSKSGGGSTSPPTPAAPRKGTSKTTPLTAPKQK